MSMIVLLSCAALAARQTSSVPGLAPSWRSDRPRASLMDIPKRLRKKLTFRTVGGTQVDIVKREHESVQHVLMKAIVWALHADAYNELQIELPIGDRYTPDCIALDQFTGAPVFWGECGRVEFSKIDSICSRFHQAHFVFAKWDINPVGFASSVARVISNTRRPDDGTHNGLVEVVSVPPDSEIRFFTPVEGSEGHAFVVSPDRGQLQWVRVWPSASTLE